MKFVGLALLVVLIGLAQVSVAPLFPVSAAIPEFALVTMVMLAVFAGPTTVMFALPLMAICVGFDSDRQPGLVLMAYLPLLPVALFVEESGLPLNLYAQMSVAAMVTGAWARFVLALGAIAAGADFAPGTLVFGLMVPGMLLDFSLLTAVYLPVRLLGRPGRGMTLQRSRW